MVDEKNKKKEPITVRELGDLSADCIFSATKSSILILLFGGGAIQISQHLLKPIYYIRPEVRFLTTSLSSLFLGLYSVKWLKNRCDKKISDMYDTDNPIR